jgi:ribonuclease T1
MHRVASATAVSRNRRPGRRFHAVAARVWALAVVVLAVGLAGLPGGVEARRGFESIGAIRASDLPVEGRDVLAAIHAGGPFVSRRDGAPFGNREGVLPRRERGYYAEYTVPTPGARNRGVRRIIAGRGRTGDFRTSDEYYYTNDHYETFRRILQ